MLKRPIEIPVYEYTDEELNMIQAGIEDDNAGFNDGAMRTFLVIDSWFYHKTVKKVAFYSSGIDYYTPLSLDEFEELIKTALC